MAAQGRLVAQVRGTPAVMAMAYVPPLLCIMTIGVLVPFLAVLGDGLGASDAQLGLTIALFSVPPALLAGPAGNWIDRQGGWRALLLALLLTSAGSVIASQAGSLWMLGIAILVCGLGFGIAGVAAPCLLITQLTGTARVRAISFLSSYAPSGYAAGLLLAVPFTAAGAWRTALLVHAAALAVCALVLLRWRMPGGNTSATGATPPGAWLTLLRRPRVLRLGISSALLNALAYGTSLAAPGYLARVHGVSIAASSTTVALAKIVAVLLGGLGAGWLLARRMRLATLFTALALLGALAQLLLFLPASGLPLAGLALMVWLFAFGSMAGGAMTLLAGVAGGADRSGSAAGIVNQCTALASVAAPSLWLAAQSPAQFIALAWTCLLVSLLALPVSSDPESTAPPPVAPAAPRP